VHRTFNFIVPAVWGIAVLLAPHASSGDTSDAQSTTGSFDHIRILVHDISAARNSYRDQLGFSFPYTDPYVYAEGSAHDTSDLPDGTYLELVGITDRAKLEQVRPWIVRFLETQQGVHSIGLQVPSANSVAHRLQSRGITAPIFKLARANPQDPPVLLVTPKLPHLPEGAIFFLEYPPRKRGGDESKAAPIRQTNTAERIVAVWIVVKDLARAADELEMLGFRRCRSLRSATLGAKVREFAADRGRIVLLGAAGNGAVAQFANARGMGVMGFTLAAPDLERARALVERSSAQHFETYQGLYGTSFLIPGDSAEGAWIEMAQE
jgi:catechol 2,3-dioxygenase-like lactoylglutathione lyase family enzyme